MIRYPDSVVGTMDENNIPHPGFIKHFIYGGTDSKIHTHECLYEGKEMYEKLDSSFIIAQVTLHTKDHEKRIDGTNWDKFRDIELTPIIHDSEEYKPKEVLDNGQKIWRFMSLSKFNDIINHKHLHFSRIDQFDDKLEGMSPSSCIKAIINSSSRTAEQTDETLRLHRIRMNANRKNSYALCWHINNEINHELWNEYGGNSNESIAIQTNPKLINNTFKSTMFPVLNESIRYFDKDYFNHHAYWFPTLFKQDEFKHEREYRSILFVYGFEMTGLKIQINPEKFIQKIYVHPDASKEFFKKIRLFVKNSGFKIPVQQKRPD